MQITYVFSQWLTHTHEKDAAIISMSDLFFIQNLPEGEKIELVSEVTNNMFKVSSIFSHISVGRGDDLALGNPTKERDT